jgi:hypothetical protein
LPCTSFSLIAQLAEQPTVNRQVLGSSPSQGANARFEINSPTRE